MPTGYKIKRSISINTPSIVVWDILTNPKKIRNWLNGSNVTTDWKPGSPIIFQGEYEGTPYKDKGIVKQFKRERILQYLYWSGFSGLPDKEENYQLVTIEIDIEEDSLKLTASQSNLPSKQNQEHAEHNWGIALEKIRKMAEEEYAHSY